VTGIGETDAFWIAPHVLDYVVNPRHGVIVSLLVLLSSASRVEPLCT
jgi:hypothetical protein